MKLSIITPVYNGEKYIRETIESVISQEGNFEIEYIIVDGLSTDSTVRIAQEYIDKLARKEITPKCTKITLSCFSEKDAGMYDAINKGFSRTSGEILAWINADDYYLPGALALIAKGFSSFSEIEWLKGRTCAVSNDPSDKKVGCAPCYIFEQSWIQRGIYGRNAHFIHQDSVFWRRSLWNKVAPIDTNLKLAGDYWLWTRFAEHASLYSLNATVSVFRKVPSSLSHTQDAAYRTEQRSVVSARGDALEKRIKLFFWMKSKLRIDWPFITLYPLLFKRTQKAYIDVTASGEIIMKKARSYIA